MEYKKNSEIGPSRFTSYMNILFGGVVIIIFSLVIHSRNNFNEKYSIMFFTNIFLSIKVVIIILENIIRQRIIIIPLFILFLLFTFIKTFNHPLDYYYKGQARTIVDWFSNIHQRIVWFYQVQNLIHFLIRIYAERAIFADSAFPFSEDFIEEFNKRYQYVKNFNNLNEYDFGCLNKLYNIDFLIIPSNKKFTNIEPVFYTKNWTIYNLGSFSLKNSCEENNFFLLIKKQIILKINFIQKLIDLITKGYLFFTVESIIIKN